jgi:hypothetical protein
MAEARSRQAWAHTSSLLAMLANQNLEKPKYKPGDFNPHARSTKSAQAPKVSIQVLKQIFIDNQGK